MINLPQWVAKALDRMTHPGQPLSWTASLPRTKFNYQAEVGDGMGSSVIMAPVQWITRTFPEAPLQILRKTKDGADPVIDHALALKIARPNPHYSGMSLWMATLTSWNLNGNAYWLKVRNGRTRGVEELWYVPHWTMTPKWPQDGSQYISHYEYNPGSGHIPVPIDVEDVVHFRNGIDPRNTRLGLSPLASVLREVFTDDEASNFTASILRNMGVVGVVVSPANEGQSISDDDAKSTKAYFEKQFTGDNRGRPIVMRGPTKVEQFGFSAKDLQLGDLRDVSEERVCAVLGIPAAVIGFGTGLQATKVGATMREMIKLAWTGNLIPTQRFMAEQIQFDLLPEFEPRPEQFTVAFDRSKIEALQESENEMVTRFDTAVRGGWLRVAPAQQMMGWEPDDSQDVYLRSMATVEVATGNSAASPKRRKGAALELLENNPPPKRTPTSAQRRLMTNLERQREKMTGGFEKRLDDIFQELGREAERAARSILKAAAMDGTKESVEVEAIMTLINMKELRKKMMNYGEGHFLDVAHATYETVSLAMGLEIGFTDLVQKKILEEGGRRLGLIDLKKQTRDRLFRELAEGRELGESVPQIIRRIRDKIPSGPWSDSKTRAEIIARTETLNAQRMATVEAYKESGVVTRVLVMDNRLGFDDEDCTFWDGREIGIDQAEEVMADEHPNGTRSVVPIFD